MYDQRINFFFFGVVVGMTSEHSGDSRLPTGREARRDRPCCPSDREDATLRL